MDEVKRKSVIYNHKFRVIFTWIWFFVGAIVVILIFFIIKGFNIEEAMGILNNERHLMVYLEFCAVGFMPLLLSIVCKDDPSLYGLNMKKTSLGKSILLSLIFIAILYIIGYLLKGTIMSYPSHEYNLEIPWNFIYGVASVFTWGPLEMFFFVWLVVNTDLIFNDKKIIVSKGLIITTIIFAALHIITTDIQNAVYTGLIFFALGLIYKFSDNIIGPAIAWTMLNGTVWMVSRMFLI